jgi:hypothetical protein
MKMKRSEVNQTLRDALECLKGYHAYGEDMRNIGRGYHPTGTVGQSVESVMMALANDIKKTTPTDRNKARRDRDDVMRSVGMVKVKGNLGGTYWE